MSLDSNKPKKLAQKWNACPKVEFLFPTIFQYAHGNKFFEENIFLNSFQKHPNESPPPKTPNLPPCMLKFIKKHQR